MGAVSLCLVDVHGGVVPASASDPHSLVGALRLASHSEVITFALDIRVVLPNGLATCVWTSNINRSGGQVVWVAGYICLSNCYCKSARGEVVAAEWSCRSHQGVVGEAKTARAPRIIYSVGALKQIRRSAKGERGLG
jgi:hypothetical protein